MKPLARTALGVAALIGWASFIASGQTVISAKSGLIHYAEGRVYLGDQPVENKFGNFPEVKENQQLRTEEGRAEVLLTPGVFLRIGESSSIRMITNRLIDTRVEFLSGSILAESDELLKDNSVTIVYKDYAVQLLKKGLYRFDSDPAELRVYDGEATAEVNGKTEQIKEGHLLAFDAELKLAKFNKDDVDELYLWSRRRSEYLAMANVSAAKAVRDNGSWGTGNGYWGMNPGYWGMSNWYGSGWYWNPYFNMFTFIPYNGVAYSPFGFAFWSPFTVYNFLSYAPVYYGGGGGGGVSHSRGISSSARATVAPTRSGLSGTVASSSGSVRSPSTAASGSVSSVISHGTSSGHAGGGHR